MTNDATQLLANLRQEFLFSIKINRQAAELIENNQRRIHELTEDNRRVMSLNAAYLRANVDLSCRVAELEAALDRVVKQRVEVAGVMRTPSTL